MFNTIWKLVVHEADPHRWFLWSHVISAFCSNVISWNQVFECVSIYKSLLFWPICESLAARFTAKIPLQASRYQSQLINSLSGFHRATGAGILSPQFSERFIIEFGVKWIMLWYTVRELLTETRFSHSKGAWWREHITPVGIVIS